MLKFFLLGIYGLVVSYLPSWFISLLCSLGEKVFLLTSMKSRVQRGMKQFPLPKGCDIENLTRKHLRFLLFLFHQFLRLRYHRHFRHRLGDVVRRQGEEFLKEALKAGRGVILVSLHLGNFIWSISYLASVYPVNLVARAESNPRWEAYVEQMRKALKIKTIYREGAAWKVKDGLRKGEVVVFLIDQYVLPFFYGPDSRRREIVPRLARSSGAPVIPFYTLEGEDGLIILRFLPPLEGVSSSKLEEIVINGIREDPHLWFWWRRLGKANIEYKRLDYHGY